MPDQQASAWRPKYWREWFTVFCIVSVMLLTFIIVYVAAQYIASTESNWPLEEPKADHPVGNTFGELVAYRSRFGSVESRLKHIQHFGLDILAEPCCTSSAPDVVVTEAGVVRSWNIVDDDNYNSVEITASRDGHEFVYTYKHLEVPQANSYQTFAETNSIPAGTPISMVRDAFPCGFNHLHYGITRDFESINPLQEVVPEPDGQDPVISELHVVKHGIEPLSEFGLVNNCPTVSGAVDVIVEVSDEDDAGSSEKAAGNLGIYDLKWRACAVGNPNCNWLDTHKYDAMPAAWNDPTDTTFKERFSLYEPFPTIKEEWSDVPEGWMGDPVDCEALPVPRTIMFVAKDGIATWNTQEKVNGVAKYKNGPYTLSVKALDYAGNDDIYETTVCVNN